MKIIIAVLLACLPAFAQATETVRVKISGMSGTEPASISTTSHSALFVLSSSIASASLTHENLASPGVDNEGAAKYYGGLTPASVAGAGRAGHFTLTITPPGGTLIKPTSVTYTTSLKFPNNPSSIRLLSSEDNYGSTLATIRTDVERTTTTNLDATASNGSFLLVWEAADDFGANGGGAGGFSTNDIVVTFDIDPDGDGVFGAADAYPNDATRSTVDVPTLPLFGYGVLVALLGLFGLRKLRQ